MTRIVGHQDVITFLMGNLHLSPVTLLLGPEGVGKTELAIEIAGQRGYLVHDVHIARGPVRAEHVQVIHAFCRTAASSPKGKLVILSLDEAPAAIQNALLKLLEEPPSGVRFILTASEPPLVTVVSRSHVLRCGLLTDAEVEEVLRRLGHDGPEAREAACLAGGRVSVALSILRFGGGAMVSVRAALAAVSARDPDRLRTAFWPDGGSSPWHAEHHRALLQWAAEAVSYRWHVFSSQDAPGLSRKDAEYVLSTMTALSSSRSWLVDRAIMEQLAARPAPEQA